MTGWIHVASGSFRLEDVTALRCLVHNAELGITIDATAVCGAQTFDLSDDEYRFLRKTLAALPEVSELPQPVQPTKEDCSAYRRMLKETASALALLENALDPNTDPSPVPSDALLKMAKATLSKVDKFLADPQQVKTDSETARGESLLITLRDIQDEIDNYNSEAIDCASAFERIITIVNDVLAKAEGR